MQLLWDQIVLYRRIYRAADRHSFEDCFRCSRAEHVRRSALVPEISVGNLLNPKTVLGVGLCHLWNLSARRLHVDLADFVAFVQSVTPPASPAAVIGVPDSACLRNVVPSLAETNRRVLRLLGHHFRCAGRALHEIGGGLARARHFRFEELADAFLSLTGRCGLPRIHRTGEFLQSCCFGHGLQMKKECDG